MSSRSPRGRSPHCESGSRGHADDPFAGWECCSARDRAVNLDLELPVAARSSPPAPRAWGRPSAMCCTRLVRSSPRRHARFPLRHPATCTTSPRTLRRPLDARPSPLLAGSVSSAAVAFQASSGGDAAAMHERDASIGPRSAQLRNDGVRQSDGVRLDRLRGASHRHAYLQHEVMRGRPDRQLRVLVPIAPEVGCLTSSR
jgi:hypothetical protein